MEFNLGIIVVALEKIIVGDFGIYVDKKLENFRAKGLKKLPNFVSMHIVCTKKRQRFR